jgi:drug/metabolite transporter (DMT)-like permease
VGSNLAGLVQQFQLILSLILAIVFLGETLTPLKVLGILLVVSGPSFVIHGRQAEKRRAALRRWPRMPQPRPNPSSSRA